MGVGFGASTLHAIQKLSEGDVYYCFDFKTSIVPLLEDLSKVSNLKCTIVGVGNSNKMMDSYNWELSKFVQRMHRENRDGMFDVVYLDGAHDFARDGLAICLLKILMKQDGILVLDDVMQSIDQWASPAYLEKFFTPEQAKDLQILRAQQIFLENDPNFEQLSKPNAYRGVFKRKN